MILRRGRERPRHAVQKTSITQKMITIQIQRKTKIPMRTARRPLQVTDIRPIQDAARVYHLLRPEGVQVLIRQRLDAVFRLRGEVMSCHPEGAFPEAHLRPPPEALLQSKPYKKLVKNL